jgi:hypothetical protein
MSAKKKLVQKQKQKQKQSVVVNVHLGKSRSKSNPKSSKKKKSNMIHIPPPIHQVHVSPIHDLVPQSFSKEGKQITQPTLAEQIEKYFQGKEQTNQGNILGKIPQSVKKTQNIQSKIDNELDKLYEETTPIRKARLAQSADESEIDVPVIAKKKRGRPLGSKNKPKINATEVSDATDVFGVAELVSEPAIIEKDGVPTQIPDEFMREQWLLRPRNISESNYQNVFNTPRQPDQPLNANIQKRKSKTRRNNIIFDDEFDEV